MPFERISIESPIEEKIAWAESCFRQAGDQLLRDGQIVGLLTELKEAIRASDRKRAETGIGNECKDCEERDGGSCCGAGLENRYDTTTLVINFLLGAKIPKERYDPVSCLFLGKTGCLLLARHVICVNYLCKKITGNIVHQELLSLQEREGVELELLFLLSERIRERLKA
jgi:hypothetical protein